MAVIVDIDSDPRESAWFPWRGGEARVELCLPDDSDMEKIYDDATETEYKEIGEDLKPYTVTNPIKVKRGIWDASIKNFDGILTSDNVPLKPDYDTKMWLMLRVPDFKDMYERGMESLRKDSEKKRKELEKNLRRASSANSKKATVEHAEVYTKKDQ